MKGKVLITGISGSGGSYLAEYLAFNQKQIEIHGLSRWHSTASNKNLAGLKDRIVVHECDLTDFSSIFSVLKCVQPENIFHLASHANVRASFVNPLAILQNNIMGTANLFEAVRISGLKPRVLLCSTSEVYGQVNPKNVPINEECPINPINPYAVSKTAQDQLGYVYFKSYGLDVIRIRMFAYLNPRRADIFSTSFAMQVARIEAGLQKELFHGNLDSTRTIIDVRDAMSAYGAALEFCKPGEVYNVGGTVIITVGEFLDLLKKMAKCSIPSRPDPALYRPTDVTLQIPDTSKFVAATGWSPKYSFAESVDFLLAFCRAKVRRGIL